ncbi:putative 60S ribosomal protein L31 [Blattamonas nauphoetae]|uniref:60S ribosomal protein L31 n=1 Tax=Blattamonas nauphoetae TaxID=2049346 RepID=A0ABQ9YL96_9EUKA|nr:putative 60S ribosomal protein L31 [Blattamonas nauphoetae]KAK2964523.1 putative 60S ribosomal protein L31 [Blattamonas nauphoetae]
MVKGKKIIKGKEIEKRNKGPKTLEMTINLHKACHELQFKKKAPRAIKTIKKFAKQFTRTRDVRLDPEVNLYVWKKGIRNPPRRIRVRFERKLSEDEEAKDKYYVAVSYIKTDNFHNLRPRRIEQSSN